MAESIANTIEGDIISGKRAPGERLVEREIAAQFQVSSIPVREALQILETRGLVIKRINRGCSVIELSSEEMAQMSELRDWLEPKVVEWAACRRTEAGIAELSVRLQRLRLAAESGDYARFFADDLEFHRCIWDLAGNPPAARALMTVVGCLFACGLRNAAVDLRLQYLKHERLYQSIAESRPADAGLLLADISAGFRGQLYRVSKGKK
ncbi:MAG: GntR family transcriptional regulator [Bryobacteraceae bacterium]